MIFLIKNFILETAVTVSNKTLLRKSLASHSSNSVYNEGDLEKRCDRSVILTRDVPEEEDLDNPDAKKKLKEDHQAIFMKRLWKWKNLR